jgi:nitroimidazol reductase NimA-like FMN-containing flavoprotein (pyridoxamine 5'-phosphate oxidase superfamily)
MKTVGIDERIIEDRSEMEAVLRAAKVGRLGICWNGQPLIIPVNFAYDKGMIYFHGSDLGLKTEFLRTSSDVCFEVDEFLGTVPAAVPCEYDAGYRSVLAFGTAQVLPSPDEKLLPLQLIVAKYAGEEVAKILTRSMVKEYRSSRGRATAVVRIQVERMTGKRSIKRTS